MKGNFTGNRADNTPYEQNSEELRAACNDVHQRMTRLFAQRADYTKITQALQKDAEDCETFRDRLEVIFRQNSGVIPDDNVHSPYQQQFKNALLLGFQPHISEYIRKK